MKTKNTITHIGRIVLGLATVLGWQTATAGSYPNIETLCQGLPSHADLKAALTPIVTKGGNGGFGTHVWASVVNRDGVICAVTFSGVKRDDQMPTGRVVSAQKANTANAMSLAGFSFSTANLFSISQPGNMMFGSATTTPFNTEIAFKGSADQFGQVNDPMVGHIVGGSTTLAGGLALYNQQHQIVGGLAVGGDLPCSDHIIAWKLRDTLALDFVPYGVSPSYDDNIVHDITVDPATGLGRSMSGYGYPVCTPAAQGIAAALPIDFPTGLN